MDGSSSSRTRRYRILRVLLWPANHSTAWGDTLSHSRTLSYQWDAAFGRAMATTPLTVRIDLEPHADTSTLHLG